MNTKQDFTKRYVVLPAATALLVMSAVAAVNAVQSKDMIATDGKIEVVDGRHVQTLTRQMPFERGSSLKISNGNGRIEVSGWDQDELLVTATKQMEVRVGGLGWVMNKLKIPFKTTEKVEDFFDEVRVDVSFTETGVEFKTIVPKWKPGVNVSIHYDVKLPKHAAIDVSTTNGHVTVQGIEGAVVSRSTNGRLLCEDISGPIEASTHNGTVVCKNVSGPVQANTANGSVTIDHPAALREGDSIVCGTSNGSIKVHLPRESSFDVLARTTNGRIRSAFDVDSTGERISKRRLAGRVGHGGATVELRTVNGSITIGEV